MEVVLLPDAFEIAKVAADAVQQLLEEKPDAVLGLATGSSPLPLYNELVRRHKAGKISFAQCTAFTLDEYVGLPVDHPAAYCNVIREEFTDHVDFAPGAVHGPDGMAEDLRAAAASYEQAIADSGGIDLQILGIGTDGHIAFNEPGSSLASRTRMKTLTPQTRADNARFFDGDEDAVPWQTLTQGMGTIMEARHLLMIATGRGKAEAVQQMVEGPISAMWPATLLQMHPRVSVLLDPGAAGRLQLGDYYRTIWENKPEGQRL